MDTQDILKVHYYIINYKNIIKKIKKEKPQTQPANMSFVPLWFKSRYINLQNILLYTFYRNILVVAVKYD